MAAVVDFWPTLLFIAVTSAGPQGSAFSIVLSGDGITHPWRRFASLPVGGRKTPEEGAFLTRRWFAIGFL
jgi:hypothetical protein